MVDYLGLAHELSQAMANYTTSGGKGDTAIDQEEAVAVMKGKYEVCTGIMAGFDWSAWFSSSPTDRVTVLPGAQEHILAQEDGKNRFVKAVVELSKAFALAVPHEEALAIRDDLIFFQAVKAVLVKGSGASGKTPDDIDHAIRQILSRSVVSEGIIDIFAALV